MHQNSLQKYSRQLILLISCRYLIKRHQFKCISSEKNQNFLGGICFYFTHKNEKRIDNENVEAIEERFNFNNPNVYIMQKVLFAFKFNNQHSIRWEYFTSLDLEFLMRNQK